MNSFDVVVIGAGIIGCSVAYHLSKAGYTVALVDKGDVASGTSSRCDAVALICDKKPGIDTEMGFTSIQLYKKLAKELSFDFEFSSRGSLYVCETDQELEIANYYVNEQAAAGYDMKMVDGKELLDIEPYLARDLAGGIWTEVDSTMNPYLVCFAFVEEAKKYGLKLYSNHEVKAIKKRPDGSVEAVVTDKAMIHTKKVVNCAGVWAGKIGQMVGIDIPIKPRKGMVLVSEKTKPVVSQKVHEFGYMLSKFEDINYSRNVSKVVEENNIAFTIEPTEAGNFLLGGHRSFKGYDITSENRVMRGIAERALRFLPVLKDIACIRSYAGIRPWVVDHLPIVSDVEEVPGFYIASGHEGDGISMAPITGRMMTQLISNHETDFNIDRLKFSRYKQSSQII
ncbi:NAD(P)/FAD-dependent oxidoreductase [Pseudalkalibacillus salsuginis]|uniref:NAD(P)/FAD-dependent oxidoreductase n=1 Tax=Pseudalkalibacillus salsuginis TaxID=2910972 RepID=UPI001F1BFAAF|nr:FAD-dependent oxidoreductase [Pseudalkalibacillus salsuginis]MCF6409531.1 FAD-binding oxidoreductase [Pseudalkalibacillus salsuginis]